LETTSEEGGTKERDAQGDVRKGLVSDLKGKGTCLLVEHQTRLTDGNSSNRREFVGNSKGKVSRGHGSGSG